MHQGQTQLHVFCPFFKRDSFLCAQIPVGRALLQRTRYFRVSYKTSSKIGSCAYMRRASFCIEKFANAAEQLLRDQTLLWSRQ